MPDWACTCDIKDIIRSGDGSDLTGCAREIADCLRNTLHGRKIPEDHDGFDELTGIIDKFEDEFHTGTFEDFNEVLEELYDWADCHRVWLGP